MKKRIFTTILLLVALSLPLSIPSANAIGSDENRDRYTECMSHSHSIVGDTFCVGEFMAEQFKDLMECIF